MHARGRRVKREPRPSLATVSHRRTAELSEATGTSHPWDEVVRWVRAPVQSIVLERQIKSLLRVPIPPLPHRSGGARSRTWKFLCSSTESWIFSPVSITRDARNPRCRFDPFACPPVQDGRGERRHWRAANDATKALQKTQHPTRVSPKGDATRQRLGDGDRVEHRDVTPSSKSASKLERFSAATEFVKAISSRMCRRRSCSTPSRLRPRRLGLRRGQPLRTVLRSETWRPRALPRHKHRTSAPGS